MRALLMTKKKDIQLWVLCFTANTAGSTIKLKKTSTLSNATLETSTDWATRTTYTFWDIITLSNVWDKLYWRNTSTTTTGFSTGTNTYYQFIMTGSINGSWDVTSLINKNCTDTLVWNYCFYNLFASCDALITPPKLLATGLTEHCYYYMFHNCNYLEKIPELPAITLYRSCYYGMFQGCTKIKISKTQTWEYQTEYRIPKTWTWTTATNALTYMFSGTWWAYAWNWSINTTYYISNDIV